MKQKAKPHNHDSNKTKNQTRSQTLWVTEDQEDQTLKVAERNGEYFFTMKGTENIQL